ncbi:DNA cytosine methyltransferase [Halomonas elongata]|uniref:DNA (cytosine-5-)-methyltransferase n=1 Tax=Halomonas elongata (strain ATCC 33173 / DSM 2581 / NBRC 15536 / NCIMB 2198 / 1H9) TaxID=768066 RepID=E1VCB2_HALED|nr:DNA cytosine methyltransferase [Halomonas elongata]WBF18049.1 DNA cytosine methyltransferase [Halomonas elongata]WPU46899.1 DNA cytosine methyltransferase [Halomonas elongata DSM 2581]CBV44282.1 probable methyltransferase (homolog to DNA-cytosine methyltransferase) [Halomonas elongata DSM 2581]
MTKPIHIVDLFAGPGGLGEGFSSIRRPDGSRQFKTLVSVEKDAAAHRTLTMRAFYRLLHDSGMGMSAYYDYLLGGEHPSARADVQHLWDQAREEALCLKLGSEDGNRTLEDRLRKELTGCSNWVLIGGPPCQAYSVAGRVRNHGKKNYRPEEDDRHFLYREYLDVIAKFRPAVFVMENVRGMLTSRVGKDRIFGQILEDLRDPSKATGHEGPRSSMSSSDGYTIFSLEDNRVYFPKTTGLFDSPAPLEEDEYNSFVIKADEHGIPQARHRVILVGVRNDIVGRVGAPAMATSLQMQRTSEHEQLTVADVLAELPALRSGLSRHDSDVAWYAAIKRVATEVAEELLRHPSEHIKPDVRKRIAEELLEIAKAPLSGLNRRYTPAADPRPVGPTTELEKWYHGAQRPNLKGLWYNHEARSHMEEDLARYLYCATFAKVVGHSPIGTKEIYLDYLAPLHANWKSGKFADRFKVVLEDQPSKTITSHISKDGHYFIHYDPRQCRSLTVREAARLQTFPDDYYFEGNRTEQYVQVGNAVPPLLARRIAVKVMEVLDKAQEKEEKQQVQAVQA